MLHLFHHPLTSDLLLKNWFRFHSSNLWVPWCNIMYDLRIFQPRFICIYGDRNLKSLLKTHAHLYSLRATSFFIILLLLSHCSWETTTPSRESCTADPILISFSRWPAAWTKALKVIVVSPNLFDILAAVLHKNGGSSFSVSGTPKIVKPEKHVENEVKWSWSSCGVQLYRIQIRQFLNLFPYRFSFFFFSEPVVSLYFHIICYIPCW